MSHIADLACAFNNLDALEKAINLHHGGQLIRGATTYRWVGRWYDDSPVPRYLFGSNEKEYLLVCGLDRAARKAYMENLLGKCSHKIVFPGHTYEVGVVNVEGNNLLVWDWATPLNNIMGFVYSDGRQNMDPLAPFLANYQQFAWEMALGDSHHSTSLEMNSEASEVTFTFELE